ncbi:hypothetical protein F5Y19DRAFT_209016 [Xylariaceae sp. FL1651]|nr:hypothetical protein F5Y19DRAFT_209016 [Xylariaceae sp. FL1651]
MLVCLSGGRCLGTTCCCWLDMMLVSSTTFVPPEVPRKDVTLATYSQRISSSSPSLPSVYFAGIAYNRIPWLGLVSEDCYGSNRTAWSLTWYTYCLVTCSGHLGLSCHIQSLQLLV